MGRGRLHVTHLQLQDAHIALREQRPLQPHRAQSRLKPGELLRIEEVFNREKNMLIIDSGPRFGDRAKLLGKLRRGTAD